MNRATVGPNDSRGSGSVSEKALEELNLASKLNPQCYLYYYIKAKMFYYKKWWNDFLVDIKKANGINPVFEDTYSYLLEYYSSRDLSVCTNYYNQIVEHNPYSSKIIDYIQFLMKNRCS